MACMAYFWGIFFANIHWEIKGRFRKRMVLANVPSFLFSFRGNMRTHPRSGFSFWGSIRQNHSFGNHPFGFLRNMGGRSGQNYFHMWVFLYERFSLSRGGWPKLGMDMEAGPAAYADVIDFLKAEPAAAKQTKDPQQILLLDVP